MQFTARSQGPVCPGLGLGLGPAAAAAGGPGPTLCPAPPDLQEALETQSPGLCPGTCRGGPQPLPPEPAFSCAAQP